ncbi:Fic family protein [Actinomyces culturomici]|uniref:Fic family protein n=1 Tax=Actinomyces culturomici TaxID=1926276 RepID=UPI000E1FB5BD|nr:Fic family protein [Actinomyces culturomici]
MKIPVPPPASLADLEREILDECDDRRHFVDVLTSKTLADDPAYHPWEWFFRHQPPAGFTTKEWWVAVRSARLATARSLPLTLKNGEPLTFNLPDPLLRLIDEISARARGQIELPEPVANPTTRNRYLVRSLIEESMTSSQLEGAATSRVDAKRMLRENRPPKDRSERMILNNFLAMKTITELRSEPLTPQLIREIHKRVTNGTLDDPNDAGRVQRPGDARVRVVGDLGEDQILHAPPRAEELPARMEALCEFANAGSADDGPYVPALVRAMTLHFMMGYDHYFADGNGRTARAIFYWSMLNQGFFLTEFLSISRLLLQAPSRYARSFLFTEQDEGDLTYFLLEQARVVDQAITDLDAYLVRKTDEVRRIGMKLRGSGLNHRQIALLEAFARDPGATTTVAEHQRTHGVSNQTARSDLQLLQDRGYLKSAKVGKTVTWFPDDDLVERIENGQWEGRERTARPKLSSHSDRSGELP